MDVVSRSMQILQMRTEDTWRRCSDLVIVPQVCAWPWHDFRSSTAMIAAGADAARKAVPVIKRWLEAEGAAVSLPPAA